MPTMKELLDPALADAAQDLANKDNATVAEYKRLASFPDDERKATTAKLATDKLKASGPVAMRPAPDAKSVTICKASGADIIVETYPFADTVAVPDDKSTEPKHGHH